MATSRQRRISWGLGVAVFVVSVLIIFHRLGFGSIWRDEAFSVELAKQSWGTMLHVVLTVEGNMFFYYLVMHLWLGLLHMFHIRWSAFMVRVPNALGYVGAALAIWRLADYLTGRAGGLIAVMVMVGVSMEYYLWTASPRFFLPILFYRIVFLQHDTMGRCGNATRTAPVGNAVWRCHRFGRLLVFGFRVLRRNPSAHYDMAVATRTRKYTQLHQVLGCCCGRGYCVSSVGALGFAWGSSRLGALTEYPQHHRLPHHVAHQEQTRAHYPIYRAGRHSWICCWTLTHEE